MTGMVGQPAGFLQRTVKMSAALTVPGGAACAGRPVQAGRDDAGDVMPDVLYALGRDLCR
jgi:hypothetical protein